MSRRARLPVAALAAALALAAFVANASASTFTVVERAIKATSATVSFESQETTVRCPITLEGSFSSGTFEKTAGARIGSIGRASLGECTGGTARVLTEALPWSILYSSFTGTLPVTTSTIVDVTGAAFQITPTGFPTCLARTTERSPLVDRFETESTHSIVTGIRLDETVGIPLSGESLCSLFSGRMRGTLSVKAPDERTSIQMLLTGEESLGAESRTRGIPELFINAPALSGVRSMFNWNIIYSARISAVQKIEGNPENFTLRQEAVEDCKAGTTLRLAAANGCNIRVEHALTPRPEHTRIVITYEWGIFWIWSESVWLNVTAQ